MSRRNEFVTIEFKIKDPPKKPLTHLQRGLKIKANPGVAASSAASAPARGQPTAAIVQHQPSPPPPRGASSLPASPRETEYVNKKRDKTLHTLTGRRRIYANTSGPVYGQEQEQHNPTDPSRAWHSGVVCPDFGLTLIEQDDLMSKQRTEAMPVLDRPMSAGSGRRDKSNIKDPLLRSRLPTNTNGPILNPPTSRASPLPSPRAWNTGTVPEPPENHVKHLRPLSDMSRGAFHKVYDLRSHEIDDRVVVLEDWHKVSER